MSYNKTSAIIAMCLGDGHIDKHDRLTMKHCEKQKEYFDYKLKILQTLQKQPVWNNVYEQFNPKYNKSYKSFQLATRQKPTYRIVKKWMSNGITRKLLNKLDNHAIAIWFMDDGSTTLLKSNYVREDGTISQKPRATVTYLSTYTTLEQNQVIVDYFKEVHDIRWTPHYNKLSNSYLLRMGTKEGKKFGKLIESYVLPCVRYKIDKLIIQDNAPHKEDENIV